MRVWRFWRCLQGVAGRLEETTQSRIRLAGYRSHFGQDADAGVRKGFIILKANDQPMRKVSDLEEVMKLL